MGSYDLTVKDLALKILMDYSERTGRKWGVIRAEIMDLADADGINDRRLTRQDLEAWSKRRTILGDEKFGFVFRFLTDPITRERPEFEATKNLIDPQLSTLHLGRMLGRLYFDPASYPRQTPYLDHRPRAIADSAKAQRTEEFLESIAGVYVGAGLSRNATRVLALHRPPGEPFLIAHVVEFDPGTELDWNVSERRSGFATIGHQFLLHLDHLRRPAAYLMTVHKPFGGSDLMLLDEEFGIYLSQAFDSYEHYDREKRAESVEISTLRSMLEAATFAPAEKARKLTKTDDPTITEKVEAFKWSMPLWR